VFAQILEEPASARDRTQEWARRVPGPPDDVETPPTAYRTYELSGSATEAAGHVVGCEKVLAARRKTTALLEL